MLPPASLPLRPAQPWAHIPGSAKIVAFSVLPPPPFWGLRRSIRLGRAPLSQNCGDVAESSGSTSSLPSIGSLCPIRPYRDGRGNGLSSVAPLCGTSIFLPFPKAPGWSPTTSTRKDCAPLPSSPLCFRSALCCRLCRCPTAAGASETERLRAMISSWIRSRERSRLFDWKASSFPQRPRETCWISSPGCGSSRSRSLIRRLATAIT
ncbi:hypothetical protein DFJ74DRAFT_133996 [Hyaloraphidium curvatum]|nr:hypothetical protein DFJ74DRAFT_133996 [Hyaloraphidium curvatum]